MPKVPKLNFPKPTVPDLDEVANQRAAQTQVDKTIYGQKRKAKKPFKRFWALSGLLLLINVGFAVPANGTAGSPQNASTEVIQGDKDDGECTGHETDGHCADKCANPSNVLKDYDINGVAVCEAATPVVVPTTPVVTDDTVGEGK